MKAAMLVKPGSPLVVDEIQMPERLEYGQILVKVKYSGVCGSQIGEIDGVKGEDRHLPHLLGHEGSGIVERCGPGVSMVRPDDHVVLHWRKGNGIEAPTPKYVWNGKDVNAGWVTTFNEYAIVSENRLTPIPKKFDLKLATLFGCAVTTAYGVVHNDSGLKPAQSVAIFGVGGIGTATVAISRLLSANPIIAIDVNQFKLKKAQELGATHLINSGKEDVARKLLDIAPGGVDAAIETTGIRSVRESAYELTHREGITTLVGVPKHGEKMSIDSFQLHFGKRITGSHGGNVNPSLLIPKLIGLDMAKGLGLGKMVSKSYKLKEINDAVSGMRAGKILRPIIEMQ